MTSLEQFISDTNAASNSEQIFSLYEKALREYGYDSICYCLVTDHPSVGLNASHGVLRNYSEEWMEHYLSNGYDALDPVLKHCFVTNKPFSWDWLVETKALPKDEKKLMNEAQEAKLLDGVAVPIHGLHGEMAAIGLANTSGKTELNKDILSKIHALSMQFHLAYTEKEAIEQVTLNVQLSEREREILLWASEGKSDPVIGELLGIACPTVRYHWNNIFKKLNVNERVLAVSKSIRHGFILPSYVIRF